MKCPYCGNAGTSVLESRIGADQEALRRRRQCAKCEKRFTTYERVEGVDLFVRKKSGETEQFDREKVKKGIVKATWKRPVSLEDIEALIVEVERKLRLRASKEVKSWEIGNMVMNRLRKIDPVSYLLFASVYKDFQDIRDFLREANRLASEPREISLASVESTKEQV